MKATTSTLISAAMVIGTVVSVPANADTLAELRKAAAEGKTNLSMRYRYEAVDQDGISEDANASTLKTRLTYKSGMFGSLYTKIEVDNVTHIGNDNYNSTANGKGQYPVVADPRGTDLNQAFIGYKSGDLNVTVGRQRILQHDQRFVGGVGWRQNEQTYDGYRFQYDASKQLSFDYSYIFNVNRIFGPSGAKADLGGNIHLFNANYKPSEGHKVVFYGYGLDFDTAAGISSQTMGLSYDGKFGPLKMHAAYARQSDSGDNPADYNADYWTIEAGAKLSSVNIAVGYELLGSDNGVGFTTPLATLHKFQGWADKFLGTPGAGVEDLYIKASTKVGKLGLSATWHDLSADVGGADYGNELNFVAKYPFAKKALVMLKYANYSADGHASDTDKLWMMVNVSF